MSKTTKSVKKSQAEDMSNKREKLKVLLNSINETKPIANPIIAELSKIYKDRKRYIGSADALGIEIKIQDDFILATDSDDIFEDTKVILELNTLESGELVTKSHTIETEQFQTSAFDVLIAHYELSVSRNSIVFTANDKGNKVKYLSSILFVKSYNHRTLVFTRKGEYYICNIPFGEFVNLSVNCRTFHRIHRRYIVNLKAIDEVLNHQALLEINEESIETIKKVDLQLDNKEEAYKKQEKFNQKGRKIESLKKENAKQNLIEPTSEPTSEPKSDGKDLKIKKFVHRDTNSNKVYLKVPISEELQKDIFKMILNARKISKPKTHRDLPKPLN